MLNILICDDEIELLRLVKDGILIELEDKVEISTAHNGLEALSEVLSKPYDLVITDHMMPKMTGTEFIQNMRNCQFSLNKKTPVIFLSGFIPEVEKAVSETNSTVLLSKPYNHESLLRNIKILCLDKLKKLSAA